MSDVTPTELSAFLPWNLLSLVETALQGKEAFRVVSGSVLFCDVAGFTPLTEALSSIGREGSEELTRVLNRYFTRMIEIIEGQGGDVLRFGGDAMTVLFPGDSRLQSLQASTDMMESMQEFRALQTRAGTFGISMKIGAAFGEVTVGLVGDPGLGWDYYASGPPLDHAAEAEHRAQPGFVVCHPTFLDELPSVIGLNPLEGGYAVLRETIPAPPPAQTRPQGDPPEGLTRLVPGHLAERAGRDALGEHRGTAVLFASFTGLPVKGRKLHRFVRDAYEVFATQARRYGGLVNKLDMGDKGTKAILLFGAPYACEGREEMAVRAGLDIGTALARRDIQMKAGITSDPLFSGPVGSPLRREFTVMGDGINMAARLMQAAPDKGILCGERVTRESEQRISFEKLEPIRVKGKKERIAIFAPRGERETVRATVALVERETQRDAIRRHLHDHQPRPLGLRGEVGIGKTALLDTAAIEADGIGIPVGRSTLAPYSRELPFQAWRDPIRDLIGYEKGTSDSRARELRDAALASEAPGYRCLINSLLELPEETTRETRNLSPRERRDLTIAILFRTLVRGGQRALLLDNLQWADPLSLELLGQLLADPEAGQVRLLATWRPSELDENTEGLFEIVEVGALSDDGLRACLRSSHEISDLPDEVAEWLVSRCQGNPAVLEAVVRSLAEQDLLIRDELGARIDSDRLFQTKFPETLEEIYLARVDHLPREEREVIQVASIVGTSVSLNLLRQALDDNVAGLDAILGRLAAKGLLRPDTRSQRPYVRFADSLLRDAVYRSLPFALAREGHRRIALFLDREAADKPGLWPYLAYHFEKAGDPERARHYARLAARDALQRYDNLTALRHLEGLYRELSNDPEDVEDALNLIGVYSSLGRWGEAQPVLAELSDRREQLEDRHRQRLLTYLAQDHAGGGRFDEAESLLRGEAERAEERSDRSARGEIMVNLVGYVLGPTGRIDEAGAALEQSLKLLQGPSNMARRVTAAMNLGVVSIAQGQPDEAMQWLRTAYRDATRAHLGPRRGTIADNLCGLLFEHGKFPDSIRWGRRAVRILEPFLARGPLLNAQLNLSIALTCTGRIDEAVTTLENVELRARQQRSLPLAGQANRALERPLLLQGRIDDALSRSAQALEVFRQLRSARDFGSAVQDVTELFVSLSARDEAREFWARHQVKPFLDSSPEDPQADASIRRLRNWIAGSDEPVPGVSGIPADELLQRHLLRIESLLPDRREEARRYLDGLRAALMSCPHVEALIRQYRIELLTASEDLPEIRTKALRLLRKVHGGVWGLRLLALLWQREPRARSRSRLKRQALDRLGFLRDHGPPWVGDHLQELPEVAQLLG